MMQYALVGLAAGAATALLFAASVYSDAWFSILLVFLTPLPLMIGGLGWNHWVAALASASAAIVLGVTFGSNVVFGFTASTGVPAWWLCYLTMLSRPSAARDGTTTLEWYPPGRLVVWAAGLAAMMVAAAIPFIGLDAASFKAGLHDTLATVLKSVADSAAENGAAPAAVPDRLINIFVAIIPPTAAVLATISNLLNLWLAARIATFSGRMRRPWPVLSAMHFPPEIAALLAVAVAVSFIGGLAGIVAGVLTASLLMAYAILGFAVLHAITPKRQSRPFLLGSVYAAVFLLGWPMLGLCALGLTDSLFDWRARAMRRRGLPAPP